MPQQLITGVSDNCCRRCNRPASGPTIINQNTYITQVVDCEACRDFYVSIGDGGIPPTPSHPDKINLVLNRDGTAYFWDTTLQVWIEINPSGASGIYIRDTVDDLRLVDDDGNLRYAVVFGNVVAGDGQPRTYRWNPDETGADDGITIVRPSTQAVGADGAWNEL